jgi:hypothetical protein
MDQHALAGGEPAVIEQRLPCRQRRKRHRRRVQMSDRTRLGRQVGRAHRHQFGCRSVTREIDEAVHLLARLEIGYALAKRGDNARHFVRWNYRQAAFTRVVGPGLLPGKLGRRQRGGIHLDQRISARQPWPRCPLIDHALGSASFVNPYGVHVIRRVRHDTTFSVWFQDGLKCECAWNSHHRPRPSRFHPRVAFFMITFTSVGLIKSGTFQPSRSYSAMHRSTNPVSSSARPVAIAIGRFSSRMFS